MSVLGAGGVALGGELTHNNPVAIVGGAAGGALLGEGSPCRQWHS